MFLWRACWHIGVANTRGLELAGLTLGLQPDLAVEGGVIDRDEDGVPLGILRERAVELVTCLSGFHDTSVTGKTRLISNALALCADVGLTSLHTNDELCLSVYRDLQSADRLPVRVFLTPNFSDLLEEPSKGGVQGVAPFRDAGLVVDCPASTSLAGSSSRLSVDRLKIFSDGSLGAETAALRVLDQPVSADAEGSAVADADGSKKNTGVLIHSCEELERQMREANLAGYRLEVHAIGDAAAEQV